MIRDPMTVLDRLGRTLAHQAGVKVIVGGDQACTDGKVIHLPALPVDLVEDEWMSVNGLLDHESGHVLYTDFRSIPPDPMVAQCLNTIEDLRIEDRYCRRYPGAARNLAVAHQKALTRLDSIQLPGHQQCLIGLLCRLQRYPLPRCIGPMATAWADKWSAIRSQVLGAATTSALLPHAEAMAKDLPRPASSPTTTESPLSAEMKGMVGEYGKRAGKRASKLSGPHIPSLGDPTSLANSTRRTVPGLARRLEQAVLAAGQCRWLPDQKRGRLSPRHLYRLPTGSSDRIFRKLERGLRHKTAISFVLDASSSMQSCLDVATTAVGVMAQALARLQVSTEVVAFAGTHLFVGKAFGDLDRVLLPRLAGIRAAGGTPLGDVVLTAAKSLVKQPVDRHLLIVASDGEPDDRAYCLDSLKRCEQVGIEVLGIGIGRDLSHLFRNHILVADINSMARELIMRLRPLLLKGAS